MTRNRIAIIIVAILYFIITLTLYSVSAIVEFNRFAKLYDQKYTIKANSNPESLKQSIDPNASYIDTSKVTPFDKQTIEDKGGHAVIGGLFLLPWIFIITIYFTGLFCVDDQDY